MQLPVHWVSGAGNKWKHHVILFFSAIRNGLPDSAVLALGSNPAEYFCKQRWHWNVVKLCWTKVRQTACCCPQSQWCWWRCPQQTFSLGFEEWGAIFSFQYFALEKGLVVWLSFVLNLYIKWEMWIFKFLPCNTRDTLEMLQLEHLFSRTNK